MTGILCCDECGELFFAHGFEKNLPTGLHENFHYSRELEK